MAKTKHTKADLDFPFGFNVRPRRPKTTRSKKPSKPRGSRARGGAFGS